MTTPEEDSEAVIILVSVVAALVIATAGAWKINAKANADIRAARSQEQIANSLGRIADRLDRGGLPKPSLIAK